MVANDFLRVHLDIHRAHDRAGAVCFAAYLGAFYGEHPKQVCNSQHRTIRTGVFTLCTISRVEDAIGEIARVLKHVARHDFL